MEKEAQKTVVGALQMCSAIPKSKGKDAQTGGRVSSPDVDDTLFSPWCDTLPQYMALPMAQVSEK